MQRLSRLSNDALLRALHLIVDSQRQVTLQLIQHLAEVDTRRLHVERGFSSLFAYCVAELAFSEDEACRRIEAARLTRRFPAISPLLATGAISLSVLGLLKPHLTERNQQQLLAGVSGSSARQAKEWLAALFPQPDVPTTIRKLPSRSRAPVQLASSLASPTPLAAPTPASASLASLASPTLLASPTPLAAPAASRVLVEPLSRDRFLVKFTASRCMKDKLESARALMSHANPGGELAVVLERALDLLILDLEAKKQGRTARPRDGTKPWRRPQPTRGARREVVARSGWRCAFVAEDGRRCDARCFLEFDHETPRALGGTTETFNLRILCRAHNRLAAERAFGKAYISHVIADAQRGRIR